MGCAASKPAATASGGGAAPGRPPQGQAQERQRPARRQSETQLTLADGTTLGLGAAAEKMLANLLGFLQSKAAVEETAKRVMPHRFIDMFHSVAAPSESLRQKRVDGGDVRNFGDLLELSTRVKSAFDALMRSIVAEGGLDPDATAKVDGEPLPIDGAHFFKAYTGAPVKSEARCNEKVHNDYGGDYARLIDSVRCSIVVDTEDQLVSVAGFLQEQSGATIELDGVGPVRFTIARLKNRYIRPLFNGYQDALYTIELELVESGVRALCEVQLHLAAILAHKEMSHRFSSISPEEISGSNDGASHSCRLRIAERSDRFSTPSLSRSKTSKATFTTCSSNFAESASASSSSIDAHAAANSESESWPSPFVSNSRMSSSTSSALSSWLSPRERIFFISEAEIVPLRSASKAANASLILASDMVAREFASVFLYFPIFLSFENDEANGPPATCVCVRLERLGQRETA
jgi:hypothetical protein